MSATLNTTNIKHASSSSNNIVLASDGSTTISNLSGGGKILQFQSVKYDTYLSTSSTSYVDSGLTCNIQPVATGSKIVIVGRIQLTKFNYTCIARLLRDSTEIGSNSNSGTNTDLFTFYTNSYASLGVPFMMDDSPSYSLGDTLTYKLQIKSDGGTATIYVNGHNNNTDSYYSVSYMSLMEVAA